MKMKIRVSQRPWKLVKEEEDRLWATANDCPSLGLVPHKDKSKVQSRETPVKPGTPISEPLIK
jgi:hypothetical protein